MRMLLFLVLTFGVMACTSPPATTAKAGLAVPPTISAWLSANKLGEPRAIEAQPDWANGKRYEVATAANRLLFALCAAKADAVAGVWIYETSGERTALFQAPCP